MWETASRCLKVALGIMLLIISGALCFGFFLGGFAFIIMLFVAVVSNDFKGIPLIGVLVVLAGLLGAIGQWYASKLMGMASPISKDVGKYREKTNMPWLQTLFGKASKVRQPVNVVLHNIRGIYIGLVDYPLDRDNSARVVVNITKMFNPNLYDALANDRALMEKVDMGAFHATDMDSLMDLIKNTQEKRYLDCDIIIQTGRFELAISGKDNWKWVRGALITYHKSVGLPNIVTVGDKLTLLPV